MAKKLTIKENVFVDQVVKTLNPTKAAGIAYDTKSDRNSSVMASDLLTKPRIMRAIEQAMEKVGLTDKKAARRLKQIIMKPQKLDGISVAALNTAGRWAGWDAPEKDFDLPDIPRTADEIDILLIRARKGAQK